MASRSDLGHLVRLRRLRKLSAFVASDKAARQASYFILPRFAPADGAMTREYVFD